MSGAEDTLALARRLGIDTAGLEVDPVWPAAPDFLTLIVEHALSARPAVIVECGSGISTLLLARCCALNRAGRVYSLENGAEFAARTRAELAALGLDACASVLDAPLVEQRLEERAFRWYDTAGLTTTAIDMLVVDGPPGFLQAHSRYPALPRLAARLAGGCTVFLDDAARPDEREVVARWLEAFPGASHEYLETERGCSILRLPEASTQGPA